MSESKPTKEQLAAWRYARVRNYVETLSPEALAGMVVELEDSGGFTPQFEIDEEWPERVRHLKVR